MTKIHDEQLNTVSQAAAKTLKTFRFMDIPNFIPISDKLILKMRRQFQAGEDKVEMGIITNHHLKIQDVKFNGVSGKLVSSPTTDFTKGVIFNVHGGGFVMGTARERNVLLAAAETSLPVYSVAYTLAPEAGSKVALDEVSRFYQGLLEEIGQRKLFGMGSSAGASIITAVIFRAHQQRLRLPDGMLLFAPALDISGNGDSTVFNNRRDVMSAHLALRMAQKYIQDTDPKSPMISPIYGAIGSWFPPTFMSSGTRDIMLSNVLRFAEKLGVAGVPYQYVIKEGMWHGFHWEENLPEAISSRKQAWQFLNQLNE